MKPTNLKSCRCALPTELWHPKVCVYWHISFILYFIKSLFGYVEDSDKSFNVQFLSSFHW